MSLEGHGSGEPSYERRDAERYHAGRDSWWTERSAGEEPRGGRDLGSADVSVPYGALVPVQLDNALAAGRHVATDASTQAFMREIPQCWLTGQAAGVAAAISARTDTAARAIDVAELQHELRRQGVYLQPARTPAASPS